MPVRAATAAATASVASKSHLNPDDLKLAGKLKGLINKQLSTVRFGQALSPADSPRRGKETGWTTPSGQKLIPVQLSNPPPPGSADFPTSFALVNPKTNEFYSMQAGGFTGATFAHGPVSLPAGSKFKTKSMTNAEMTKIEDAANKPELKLGKLPSVKTLLGAVGAYEFQNMVKYGSKAPPESSILGKVKYKTENFGDGYTFTALVLKSDPNKVVIQRSGGFAGMTQYSQPLSLINLPK